MCFTNLLFLATLCQLWIGDEIHNIFALRSHTVKEKTEKDYYTNHPNNLTKKPPEEHQCGAFNRNRSILSVKEQVLKDKMEFNQELETQALECHC